jgi:hypothetical protein
MPSSLIGFRCQPVRPVLPVNGANQLTTIAGNQLPARHYRRLNRRKKDRWMKDRWMKCVCR